ncbi:MAG TPA: glycerophosphodiester phosphodiesterase [Stellaceae bacterium]|nr:glycerophosphodiester phosphodiesterase [Stellaceae bacterium]
MAPTWPRIVGHRGAAGAAPENTLAGLRIAKELGARWVELDLRLTRDRCPVLLHDRRVDRTTDGRGAAEDLTWSALRRLDAGAWFAPQFRGERVPSLMEAIALLEELELGAVFELKPAPADGMETGRVVAETLTRHWPRKLPPPLVSSFDAAALLAARAAAPEISRALAVGAVPGDWQEQAEALGCVAVHADHRALDQALVANVAARLPLWAYTVNEPERARELFAWGLTAVFTDRPDLISSAIERT